MDLLSIVWWRTAAINWDTVLYSNTNLAERVILADYCWDYNLDLEREVQVLLSHRINWKSK